MSCKTGDLLVSCGLGPQTSNGIWVDVQMGGTYSSVKLVDVTVSRLDDTTCQACGMGLSYHEPVTLQAEATCIATQ